MFAVQVSGSEFESLICITEMQAVRSGVHEVQRQEDHCGLLAASLAPGAVRDPVRTNG